MRSGTGSAMRMTIPPSVLLVSKRGGKQIAPGQTAVIRVRNADGRLSDGFTFTRTPG